MSLSLLVPDTTTVRLSLHVLAATVWVGGQLVLVALLPVLRTLSPEAPAKVAQRFNAVAWPAYALLVITGMWNVSAENDQVHGSYARTLVIKVVAVAVSGLAAAWHVHASTPTRTAVLGALSGIASISALFLGVLLAG